MKIIVHDYSGHPFQVGLSRALASHGHEVLHLYSSDFQTPHGNLVRSANDPATFDVKGLSLGEVFQKHTFLKRRKQERRYGRLVADEIRAFAPEVVLSSNAPLDAQHLIHTQCRRSGCAFVFWVQDLYGEAIHRILKGRFGPAGSIVGRYYQSLEFRILKASEGVVVISEDFVPIIARHGVPTDRIAVIENWAPLEEMPVLDRDNEWTRANCYVESTNVVYTGTLGYKHNPRLLLDLARACNAQVTVFSEGAVAEQLSKEARSAAVPNLRVRSWVPFGDLPKVLAAADIVVALIEPDAGVFSVPSKVLSYMAAGRAILAAIPRNNLAARIIERARAGYVVTPGDVESFVVRAKEMLSDPELRSRMGAHARGYAEQNFAINTVTQRFITVIQNAIVRKLR